MTQRLSGQKLTRELTEMPAYRTRGKENQHPTQTTTPQHGQVLSSTPLWDKLHPSKVLHFKSPKHPVPAVEDYNIEQQIECFEGVESIARKKIPGFL